LLETNFIVRKKAESAGWDNPAGTLDDDIDALFKLSV